MTNKSKITNFKLKWKNLPLSTRNTILTGCFLVFVALITFAGTLINGCNQNSKTSATNVTKATTSGNYSPAFAGNQTFKSERDMFIGSSVSLEDSALADLEKNLNKPVLSYAFSPFELIYVSDTEEWWFKLDLHIQNEGKADAIILREKLSKNYLMKKLGTDSVDDIWQQLIDQDYITDDGTFTDKWKDLHDISVFDFTHSNSDIKKTVYNIVNYMAERYFFVTDFEPRRNQRQLIKRDLNWFPDFDTIHPTKFENIHFGGKMGNKTRLVSVFVKMNYKSPLSEQIYHYILEIIYLIPNYQNVPENKWITLEPYDIKRYENTPMKEYFENDIVPIEWEKYSDSPLLQQFWKRRRN